MSRVRTLIDIKVASVLLCLTLFPFFRPPCPAADTVVALAYEYQPFYSEAPIPGKGLDGQGHGFVIDIAEAAYNAAGVNLKVHYQPMPRSVITMSKGEYVAHIGSKNVLLVSIPKEIIESLQLGHYHILFHYLESNLGPKEITYDKLEDLHRFRIASLLGTPTINVLKKANLNVDSGPYLDTGLHKLVRNRVDLWAAENSTALFFVGKKYPECTDNFRQVEKPIFSGTIDMNFYKKHSAYALRKNQFKDGLDMIYDNGKYIRILESYFGKGRVPSHILSDEYKRRVAETCLE